MKATKKKPSVFPLRLPFSMRAEATVIAHRLGISVNEFIATAVLEKMEHVEQVMAEHEQR